MAGNKKNGKKGTMRKVKGRGDYEVSRSASAPQGGLLSKLDKVLSRLPKGTFAAGGAAMGARVGGARGASIGRSMGAGLSAISGYGDYSVKSNSLSKVSTSADMVPQFVKNEHSVRVCHREFISDLVAPALPGTFVNKEFAINPGNSALFPWGSRFAKQYSQYKIHGMVLVYKSMTSDYAAAGPLGTVIMATNYNAVDRAFNNKIEMENSEFAVSTKPSLSLIHAIECDPSVSGESTLYIRDPTYETTDTSDRRFYDYGKFQVATTGLPSQVVPGTTLGELWVSYDIEFMKPIIGGDNVSGSSPALISNFDGSAAVVSGANPSGRLPFIVFQQDTTIAAAAQNTVLPGNSGLVTAGDFGLENAVISRFPSSLNFRKNGRYCIQVRLTGATTATANTVADIGTAVDSPANVASVGTAVGVLAADLGRVASYGATFVSATGYDSVLYYEVNVTGIPDGSGLINYVNFTPQTFLAASASLVGTLRKQVTITWMSIGINGQTVSYTNPLP